MELDLLLQHGNEALTWIGFGTVVGVVARGVVPDPQDQSGAATIIMTVVGALIGCAVLKFFHRNEVIAPFSAPGLIVGLTSALIVLAFYKTLGGQWIAPRETSAFKNRLDRRRRRRAYLDEA